MNLQEYPLRDTAVYNPHLLSKSELVDLFSVRTEMLELLLEDLTHCKAGQVPQHHLILGQRGMGKTMLLRRLSFAIEDDPKLSKVWLPLTFPEEQYNVGGLSDFWFNCIDALGDTLDARGDADAAEDIDNKVDALQSLEEGERVREALALLVKISSHLKMRFVLLVDNVDLILDRITSQDWALREVLSEESAILLIGASSSAMETTYKYGRTFYEFFQIHELSGLSLGATSHLLSRYAERWENEEVLRVVRREPERIRTLHTLTGGNPRTLTLLYNILARGLDGDVRTDLENLLDLCTPLYKARLEALPPQQQRVVHALADHWHPATAARVSEDLRMDVKVVSSQLTRLVRDGVVEKVPLGPKSKTGFQVAERFFNIWYLMRTTRRARRRLIWLVEFLRMFYNPVQLRLHAFNHLGKGVAHETKDRLRHAEYRLALAGAIEISALRLALETSGINLIIEDGILRGRLNELLDLDGEEAGLLPRVEHKRRFEALREQVYLLEADLGAEAAEELWSQVAGSLIKISYKEMLVQTLLQNDISLDIFRKILGKFDTLSRELVRTEERFLALREALANCYMTDLSDFDGAMSAVFQLGGDVAPLEGLACVNIVNGNADRALEIVCEAVEVEPESASAWELAIEVLDLLCYHDAGDDAVQKLMTLINDDGDALNEVAWRSFLLSRDFDVGEVAARRAIEVDSDNALYIHILACILARKGDWSEASERAIDFIRAGSEIFFEENWPDILIFFQEAVAIDKSREAAQVIDETSMAERWQPLRAALESIALDDPNYLLRLAPEVRQPAEEIIRTLKSQPGQQVAEP